MGTEGYRALGNEEQLEQIGVNMATADKFDAVGACIFAGGFSFGMEQAGFDVAGHFEFPGLDLGADVSRQRWPVFIGSLEEWVAPFGNGMDQPHVLFMNPPCVAYAGTGKHQGTSDDRMCYLRWCVEWAMRVQPEVWAWELVPGIYGKDRSWLEAMTFRAGRLGYKCWAFLTSSALHGGYMDRRRFHFVASRVELDFEASYAADWDSHKGVLTLGDALASVSHAREMHGPLPNDKNTYHGAFADIIPYCAPGMHLGNLPDEIMHEHYRPRGRPWSGSGRPGFSHTRGRLDRPSPNVLGGHTIFHPVEDRYLTPREKATIMGFPTDYAFSRGSKAYQEIGRGLCTHNARFLGVAIMDGLKAGQPADVDRKLHAVDWRSRAKKLNMSMTREELFEWYRGRHREDPPESYGMRR